MIADPQAFFEKLIAQVMTKSPELLVKLMSQQEGTQEEFLLDLLSDRLSRLLKDPEPVASDASPEVVAGEAVVGEHSDALFMRDYEYLITKNNELASALGACDCWGDDPDCDVCQGEGRPGWIRPDGRAYAHYVRPAMRALTL